jgi:uracil-DNA glycosylase
VARHAVHPNHAGATFNLDVEIFRAPRVDPVTIPPMLSDYRALLDATIAHLESIHGAGRTHLPATPALLASLTAPQSRPAQASSPRKPGTLNPLTPPVPRLAPQPAGAAAGSTAPDRERKETAMAELRERALACRKCPNLAAARRNVVFGVGDIHSPLMFVGEAPGADEDERGEPFVGKAGQLLTRIIQTMGLDRSTVYIANILKCRPDTPDQPSGNRKPTADEMKTCLPYLLAQIDIIQPKVLVALGATAVEGLLGRTSGISRLRGHWQSFRDIPVMPTYHPAYLLRNQSLGVKREVWEDMLQVLERLGLPISDKQRGYFLKP